MKQDKYRVISTVKISLKEQFHVVKCPSPNNPERTGILQSYANKSAAKILEQVRPQVDELLQLEHPHIQSLVDVFATDDSLHIVQELDEWDYATNKLPYTPVRVKILLEEISTALNYIHSRGIAHGNISHETIVVNERHQNILTDFHTVVELIAAVGGDTYSQLRAQLAEIPVANLPTGREWDYYSLGVTAMALLTNREYRHLYDLERRRWRWETYVDCSEELIAKINRLMGQEDRSVIDFDSVEDVTTLAIGRSFKSPPPATNNFAKFIRPDLYRMIIGSFLFGILGFLGYLAWDRFQNKLADSNPIAALQPFPQSRTLTVGYVELPRNRDRTPTNQPSRDYAQLKSYLETELQQHYGSDVKVRIESAITSQEIKNSIAQKRWDIVFTFLPTNSLIAEDNKYEFVARMGANDDPYRDVCFFVNRNSGINSARDFNEEQTLALPSENTPIFTVPLYDLYGKRMRVNIGNSLANIQKKVIAGDADVGVGFCKNVEQNRRLRTLSPNRVIPVGGVFLSPKITASVDRDYLKRTLGGAPDDVQLKANYTQSSGIDYSQFRRIEERANQMLSCIDFSRNPVDFYCVNPTSNSNAQ